MTTDAYPDALVDSLPWDHFKEDDIGPWCYTCLLSHIAEMLTVMEHGPVYLQDVRADLPDLPEAIYYHIGLHARIKLDAMEN